MSPGFLSLPALSSNWRPLTAAVAHTLSAVWAIRFPTPDCSLPWPSCSPTSSRIPEKGFYSQPHKRPELTPTTPSLFFTDKTVPGKWEFGGSNFSRSSFYPIYNPNRWNFFWERFLCETFPYSDRPENQEHQRTLTTFIFVLNKLKKALFNPQKADLRCIYLRGCFYYKLLQFSHRTEISQQILRSTVSKPLT